MWRLCSFVETGCLCKMKLRYELEIRGALVSKIFGVKFVLNLSGGMFQQTHTKRSYCNACYLAAVARYRPCATCDARPLHFSLCPEARGPNGLLCKNVHMYLSNVFIYYVKL